MARTTRTLGTLVASGVPILEGLNITRETAGNALFERMYMKVTDAIREGETIAKPMGANAKPGFHPVAAFLWVMTGAFWPLMIMTMPGRIKQLGLAPLAYAAAGGGAAGLACSR
jgi:type IV pilus assembly protein PilC